jgi:hypothetical protein
LITKIARVVWAESSHRPNAICPFFAGSGQMVSGATTDGDADAEAGWVEGRGESGPVEFAGTEPLREEHAALSSPIVTIINTIRRISSSSC